MNTTLRVSDGTRDRVAALSATTGKQMQAIVDEAVLAYERSVFWESFELGYDRLSQDPEQWAAVQTERAAEAPALRDGLE